ncbi:MAG: hypothetical protein WAL63_09500 [Solirubrobacteraceae bacterium]
MQIPTKKSRMQRLTKAINPLERRRKRKFTLPNVNVGGVSEASAVKAGLVAGGLAGLTAASAGISSRRRAGRPKSDS